MELGVTDELAAQLAGFSGRLLLPGDPGYEHARGVHNALIDRRPALIAQCHGVADVVAAVGFAREHALAVSVRGGGHNVAGTAVVEGGVMIDLSGMKGVRVDPGAPSRARAGRRDLGRARPRDPGARAGRAPAGRFRRLASRG